MSTANVVYISCPLVGNSTGVSVDDDSDVGKLIHIDRNLSPFRRLLSCMSSQASISMHNSPYKAKIFYTFKPSIMKFMTS